VAVFQGDPLVYSCIDSASDPTPLIHTEDRMPTAAILYRVADRDHRTTTAAHRRLPRVSHPLQLCFALAWAITACGGSTASHDVTRERLPSGIERTTWHRLVGTPLALDTVAVWHLWRDGTGYAFGDVRAATSAPDGFFLLDGANQQVVEVTRQGIPVRGFGRRGAGPGEFQAARHLFARGDEIWVADMGLGRYTVFDADGTFLRTVPWGGPGPINADGFAITAAAQVFSRWSIRGLWVLSRLSLDRSSVDTLAVMTTLPRADAVVDLPGIGPTTMYDPPAYSPGLHWAWAGDDRIFTVTSAEYTVEERDLTGRIRRELVGPTPDLTVTGTDRQAFVAQFARLYGVDEGQLRERNPRLVDQYPFAERRAAIESIRVDPLGRLWVLANTVGEDRTRLDVFDPDLAFVGSVTGLPQPEAFTGDGDALFRIAGGGEDGLDLFLVARVTAPS
jgi:hypothetical protein